MPISLRHAGAAVLLSFGLACGMAGPAAADDTVVVPGTSFPDTSTYLSVFGCESLYRTAAGGPLVRVVRDDATPLGRRAVELDLPATGSATGAVSLVSSVATATQQVAVSAAGGTSGVAWVWYLPPGTTPGEVWVGRASLAVGPGGWQQLTPTASPFAWQRVVAATGAVRASAPAATIADFTAEHGDGPGYLLSGLGCDGAAFDLDAVRAGVAGDVTTHDLEGWSVATSISASRQRVAPGEPVQLSGTTVDAAGRPQGAALVLQARPAGAAEFRPVTDTLVPGPGGTVTTSVAPETTTDYRWFFAERSYADAHVSAEVRVEVDVPRSSESLD